VKENDIFKVTFEKLNKPGSLCMERVAPTLLAQFLTARDATLPKEDIHDIKLIKSQKPQRSNSLTRISFLPSGLSQLTMSTLQRKKLHAEKVKEKSIHEGSRMKCYIPTYLLRKVLPPELFNRSTPSAKPQGTKRKNGGDAQKQGILQFSTLATKKSRKSEISDQNGDTSYPSSHTQVCALQYVDPELNMPPPPRRRSGMSKSSNVQTLVQAGSAHMVPSSAAIGKELQTPLVKTNNQGNRDRRTAVGVALSSHKPSLGSSSKTSGTLANTPSNEVFIDLTDD